MHTLLMTDGTTREAAGFSPDTTAGDAQCRPAVVKRARKRLLTGFYDRDDVVECVLNRMWDALTESSKPPRGGRKQRFDNGNATSCPGARAGGLH